jgi:hypothetical protein
MVQVFGDRATQRRLPDEDHPSQAFFFYRAYESLGVTVQIGGRRMTLVRYPESTRPA